MARPKFIVLGFPEQGFVLSLGFTAFATNEFPFYNYNTPGLCPYSHMSFRRAVASLTSHRERKVGTSLFSSFVWLCTNDVEGKHCAQTEKTEQKKGKTRGRKKKKKVGKVVRSEGPCCPCILHLFCIWLHHQSDPFSFPLFNVISSNIYARLRLV